MGRERQRQRVTPFITVPLALGMAGCALAHDMPPSVEVAGVQLTGLSLTNQQLAVTLCVTNPNANEIAFRRVTAELDVSGAPLAASANDLPVRLPPMSSTVVPFTVVTTVQNVGPQLLGVVQSGSIDYRVHGTVALQGVFGLTLPYSRSGRLDLVAGGLGLASAASDPAPSRCTSQAGAVPTRL